MEAWRQWPLGGRRKRAEQKQTRIHLTPTGLLMEGHCTSLRFYFAFFDLGERYGDFATARAGSLRIAFVPIVIFLVAVVFLLVLLFLVWLFPKEDISGY
jgi:hypothetical protein